MLTRENDDDFPFLGWSDRNHRCHGYHDRVSFSANGFKQRGGRTPGEVDDGFDDSMYTHKFSMHPVLCWVLPKVDDDTRPEKLRIEQPGFGWTIRLNLRRLSNL